MYPLEIKEFILFATKHAVRAIPLEGVVSHSVDAIVPVLGQTSTRQGYSFVAVDFDARLEEIYFSDIYNKAIYKTPINDTSKLLTF